jgi:hypothetical protein
MLRDVMRHYGKTLLYYQCSDVNPPPIEVMNELIPVLPRNRTQQPHQLMPRGRVKEVVPLPPVPLLQRPSEGAPNNAAPLYYITKRQLVEPKLVVTTRVVIVAGSSSVYPLLETLLFVPYLNLSNIYLILEAPPASLRKANEVPVASLSPTSPGQRHHHSSTSVSHDYVGSLSISEANDPIDQMIRAMGFNNHVSIIRGRLTDIDRAHKAIIVSDETVVEYDLLVLAPARQDLTYKSFKENAHLHPIRAAEKGIFGIGSVFEDKCAVNWIKNHCDKNPFAGVVIYGKGLDAWNAVGKLIQLELIDKSRINWIIPDEDLPELGDDLVRLICVFFLILKFAVDYGSICICFID